MLEAKRWRQIEELLDRVLDLPPEERRAFLDGERIDPAIRSEVDALLAADAAAGDFLERPAADYLPALAEGSDAAAEGLASGTAIGPYRIRRPIGRGGMGEVYVAWDDRLGRRVALKRVRFEGAGDGGELRRRRFRREARLAAGVDHPAVVRIHDIVELGDEPWLVMEYVEGRTLAELLADGPLDEERALELAAQIASGLAAAHDRGVIHRDLKAQNVLVTPSGEAKILDFGLAKRVEGIVGGTGSSTDSLAPLPEPTLTARQQVLGTLGSMSPEQARGEPLDARSDLFSLGTLLYEMLTGESPFAAPTPAATLTRICTHRPPPPRARRPQLSRHASGIVERLLEKKPEQRPQSAAEVLGLLTGMTGSTLRLSGLGRRWRVSARRRHGRLLVAGAALLLALGLWLGRGLFTGGEGAATPPLYVAIAEPELAGAAAGEAALVATGVYAASQAALARLDGVAALTASAGDEAAASPSELARALGAAEALSARLDCIGRRCALTLRRLAAGDGRVLWAATLELPKDDPGVVRTAVAARLAEAYPDLAARSDALPAVEADVYRSYLELLDAFRSGREPRGEELLAALAELRREQPAFVELYLLEAEVARVLFNASRNTGRLEHALDILRRARELAPRDPRVPAYLFDVAEQSGRWQLAEQALAALETIEPAGSSTLERRAALLAHRGDEAAALELMRRAASIRPATSHLLNLALAEYRQGEIDAARRTLETLLERAPEHHAGRSLLAQLELLAGTPERAVELFETLAGKSDDAADLSNLGTAYLLVGRFDQAVARFRLAVEREPANAILLLGLADALELAGESAEAERLYARVLELLAADPELERWQRLTVGAQALAHLGRLPEAAAAAHEASEIAPDNPQVALETALVYTLTGDLNVALSRVEKARRLGLGPAWFRLPWFAPLAERAELAALVG